MPKGPKGQYRPADTVGCAVHVAKIATAEIEETYSDPKKVEAGRKGTIARAKSTTPGQRLEIAKKASKARWGKTKSRKQKEIGR